MPLTGRFLRIPSPEEDYRAFLPFPLPPKPAIRLEEQDQDLIEKANRALGRLDGLTTLLPDADLFIYFYVRKEAILSSQIEGTQSSLSDLLLFEGNGLVSGIPPDIREVSNYVAGMHHGLKRIKEDNFPVSNRLIREIRAILLSTGRGSEKEPGEFRRSQNWVGGTRPGNALFVPPPPEHVAECMANLELYLHDKPKRTPVLIKAAIAHVQFETIHPFLDGNGRLGRLLITLLLCAEAALQEPLLYLSLYFKSNRQEYYDRLQRVRIDGDWRGWLRFFLEGVRETAQQATATARRILERFEYDRNQIDKLGSKAGSVLRLHQLLQRRPVLSIPYAAKSLQLSTPTANSAMKKLLELDIVMETTGKRRDRMFMYMPYMRILEEGTEPIS